MAGDKIEKSFSVLAAAAGILFLFQESGAAVYIRGEEPYDFSKLERDIHYLEKQYPNVLEIKRIGSSYLGKAIWALRIGKGKENVLLVGAHHGREWITANMLMMMAENYADAYKNQLQLGDFHPKILDEVALWFVPMLNPDGVDIQQGKITEKMKTGLIKMNGGSSDFSRWKANALGIDLNRQYPSGWDEMKSPKGPFYKGYKGKRPLEAEEAKALVQFVEKISPLAAVSYHSSGQEIFWQFGEKQNRSRDLELGAWLSLFTGYPLSDPPKSAYGAGFTDWFIEKFQRPGFTIEICKHADETNPPIYELKEEWERNQYVGLLLAAKMYFMAETLP